MKSINQINAVIFRDDAPIPNVYAIILLDDDADFTVIEMAKHYTSIFNMTQAMDKADIHYTCIRVDEITSIHYNRIDRRE